jgi:hypothetical protein
MPAWLARWIVDESQWLPLSMGLAFVALCLALYAHRRSGVPRGRRILAAMSLFFGVTIATMAFGHLLAVTTKLASGTLRGSPLALYPIGVALAIPSVWLARHAWRAFSAAEDLGRRSAALNGWVALTLMALGLHNLPLAAPALLNVGYHAQSRRVLGWVLVGLSVAVNVSLFIGSLVFLASGQSFEQFSGME